MNNIFSQVTSPTASEADTCPFHPKISSEKFRAFSNCLLEKIKKISILLPHLFENLIPTIVLLEGDPFVVLFSQNAVGKWRNSGTVRQKVERAQSYNKMSSITEKANHSFSIPPNTIKVLQEEHEADRLNPCSQSCKESSIRIRISYIPVLFLCQKPFLVYVSGWQAVQIEKHKWRISILNDFPSSSNSNGVQQKGIKRKKIQEDEET